MIEVTKYLSWRFTVCRLSLGSIWTDFFFFSLGDVTSMHYSRTKLQLAWPQVCHLAAHVTAVICASRSTPFTFPAVWKEHAGTSLEKLQSLFPEKMTCTSTPLKEGRAPTASKLTVLSTPAICFPSRKKKSFQNKYFAEIHYLCAAKYHTQLHP